MEKQEEQSEQPAEGSRRAAASTLAAMTKVELLEGSSFREKQPGLAAWNRLTAAGRAPKRCCEAVTEANTHMSPHTVDLSG